jgi:hypothetical protein
MENAYTQEIERLREVNKKLVAKLKQAAAWLNRLADLREKESKNYENFKSLQNDCLADAKNYRATAKDIEATIQKAEAV